ncbi:MAG: dTDP-4-amino-4,6-dideoxygalactose transaminase, partial [Urechidicola sp.]
EISKYEVAVNVHYMPIPMLTAFKKNFDIKDFPQTFKNYACEITLPVYFTLTDEQVQTVIETVKKSVTTVLNK